VVFVTNDNPRGEDLKQICADIVAGFSLETHNAVQGTYSNYLQDMWHSKHLRTSQEMVEVLEAQNDVRRCAALQ
jgi:UDP-N-acetylmuramyl tripeptide synthase